MPPFFEYVTTGGQVLQTADCFWVHFVDPMLLQSHKSEL